MKNKVKNGGCHIWHDKSIFSMKAGWQSVTNVKMVAAIIGMKCLLLLTSGSQLTLNHHVVFTAIFR